MTLPSNTVLGVFIRTLIRWVEDLVWRYVRKENNDNSGVTVERVELINESSTVPKVVSVNPNPDNSLTWPVKERKDESEHAEKSGSKREFREEFKDNEGTCVGVQSETLSPERCVYSTYGSDRKGLNESYI